MNKSVDGYIPGPADGDVSFFGNTWNKGAILHTGTLYLKKSRGSVMI